MHMTPDAQDAWAQWLQAATALDSGLGERLPEFAKGHADAAAATEALIPTLPHGDRNAQQLRRVLGRIVEDNRRMEKLLKRQHKDLGEAQRLAAVLGLGGE